MAERSLNDWLRHLERIHPQDIDLGLSRVALVAQSLALTPYPITTLTVAGTNGKGSVVYCSDAILRGHGLRTGRYTSPHLLRFNERIVIDGEPARDDTIVHAFEAIEVARGDTTLTYFEFATLAALWLFREAQVDIAILEVGLGGRLDAVNLVDADLAVITAIALDHQHWLGESEEEIAPEKAAIARPGRPVVLAELNYPTTLGSTLQSIGAACLRAGDNWTWRESAPARDASFAVNLRFCGDGMEHTFPVREGLRAANVAAALQATAHLLQEDFSPDTAGEALAAVRVPARRQRLELGHREIILDVAHNPAAMAALASYLQSLPGAGRTVAAFGAMADKDLTAMVECLATVVDGACALEIPGIDRAATPDLLWSVLDRAGVAIPQESFAVDAVWQQLLAGTGRGDRIIVCGSFHSVAGIMALLPPPV